ncbi:class F sortase [Streptomyces sp. NPDC008313]|uniref:class F sortase n=1 Tax=Streptomyces sp. NPDC008313 TaxID=3364826 RepID=UPI0036E8B3DB
MAGEVPSESGSSQTTRPRRLFPGLLWPLALVVLALNLVGGGTDTSDKPASLGPQLVAPAPHRSHDGSGGDGPSLPRSAPTRLVIPQIGVDAPFTDLVIGSDGRLKPPPASDTNLVGWFAAGPSPGEPGTSIIAGHVDTKTSAAVFVRLAELKKGSTFDVRRQDGRTASFLVDDVENFSKNSFPNERVYADTPDAEVRLITCGGAYDRTAKDYTENVVVFAHLVED